jgi:cephalosporin hydroxylase
MDPVSQDFHDLYWNSRTWRWTFWHGIPTLKCPLDLWVYQELLWLVRPSLVVELGTWAGGTATFLADNMELYGAEEGGRVITVDILSDQAIAPHVRSYLSTAPFPVRIRPPHRRVTYLLGDSVSNEIVEQIRESARGCSPVIVIADSDHSFEHSYRELVLYHELVTPASWFVMEDTDGPGPRTAVARFLDEHSEFRADPQCEKFHMKFNPGGYLRRFGVTFEGPAAH